MTAEGSETYNVNVVHSGADSRHVEGRNTGIIRRAVDEGQYCDKQLQLWEISE